MDIAIEDEKLMLISNLLDENKKNYIKIYNNLLESKKNNEYLQEIFDYYRDDYSEYNFNIKLKIEALENLLEYLNELKNTEDLELNKKNNIKKEIQDIKLNIELLKKQLLSL